MNKLFLILTILLLSGCLDDPTLNISNLSKPDQFWFTIAAAIENIHVEIAPRPGQWKVRYKEIGHFEGFAVVMKNNNCMIYISNNLQECEIGGREQRIIVVGRHEIRHCIEGKIIHSNDPNKLMHKNIPCWTID